MTSSIKLSLELIQHIAKELDNYEDLWNCYAVCRNWRTAVKKYAYQRIALSSDAGAAQYLKKLEEEPALGESYEPNVEIFTNIGQLCPDVKAITAENEGFR